MYNLTDDQFNFSNQNNNYENNNNHNQKFVSPSKVIIPIKNTKKARYNEK